MPVTEWEAINSSQASDSSDLREATGDNILLELTLDGTVRYVSSQWDFLAAMPSSQLVGRPLTSVFTGGDGDRKLLSRKLRKLVEEGGSARIVFSMRPLNSRNHSVSYSETLPEIPKRRGSVTAKTTAEREEPHIEMEAQGILIEDEPKYTFWIMRQLPQWQMEAPDIVLPDGMRRAVGFGADLLFAYLEELAKNMRNHLPAPSPPQEVCRICDRHIQTWYFERHTELCTLENRIDDRIVACHEALVEHRVVLQSLLQRAASGSVSLDAGRLGARPSQSANKFAVRISSPLAAGASPTQSLQTVAGPGSFSSPNSSTNLQASSAASTYFNSLLEITETALAIQIPEAGDLSDSSDRSSHTSDTEKSDTEKSDAEKSDAEDSDIEHNVLDDKLDQLADENTSNKRPAHEPTKLLGSSTSMVSLATASELDDDRSCAPSTHNFSSDSEMDYEDEERIKRQANKALRDKCFKWNPGKAPSKALQLIGEETHLLVHRKAEAVNRMENFYIYSKSVHVEIESLVHNAIEQTCALAEATLGAHGEESAPPARPPAPHLPWSNTYHPYSRLSSASLVTPSIKEETETELESCKVSLKGDVRGLGLINDPGNTDVEMQSQSGSRHSSFGSRTLDQDSPLSTPQHVSQPVFNYRKFSFASSQFNDSPNPSPMQSPISSPRPSSWKPTPPPSNFALPHATFAKSRSRSVADLAGTVAGGSSAYNSTPVSPVLSKEMRKPSASSLCSSDDDGRRSSRSSDKVKTNAPCIKDFEIVRPISRGAFGIVYLARKKLTGEIFAIKVLKKSDMVEKNQVGNIRAERSIMISTANSPHVAKLYFTFQSREYLYLVMEYLHGGDLSCLVQGMGVLPEDWCRQYIAETVLSVKFLHDLGIIHRDLKPDNILIDRNGHTKLADFGLSVRGFQLKRAQYHFDEFLKTLAHDHDAKEPIFQPEEIVLPDPESFVGPKLKVNDGDPATLPERPSTPVPAGKAKAASISEHLQQHQQQLLQQNNFPMSDKKMRLRFAGTPDYLAPETIEDAEQSESTDWWSLGCILFEFCYGVPPFNDCTITGIFDNILHRRISWPDLPPEEDIDADTKDLIDKLLEMDPNKRLGANGAQEIMDHPYFASINWDDLLDMDAPFVPALDDPESTEYFIGERGAAARLEFDDESYSNSEKGSNKSLGSNRSQGSRNNQGSGTSRALTDSIDSLPSENKAPDVNFSIGSGSVPKNRRNSSSNSLSKHTSLNKSGGSAISYGSKGQHSDSIVSVESQDLAHAGASTSNRIRRVSRLSDSSRDEFGSFSFKNLPVLERANLELISKLRRENSDRRIAASPQVASQSWLEGSGANISGNSQHASGAESPANMDSANNGGSQLNFMGGSYSLSASPMMTDSSPFSSDADEARNAALGRIHRRRKDTRRPQSLMLRAAASSSMFITRQDSMLSSSAYTDSPMMSYPNSPASSRSETSLALNANECVRCASNEGLSEADDDRSDDGEFYSLDILVFLADKEDTRVFEKMAGRYNVHVVSCSSNREVVSRALSFVRFDLMIIDIDAPSTMGASELCRAIRSTINQNASTPLVCVSRNFTEYAASFDDTLVGPLTEASVVALFHKYGDYSGGGGSTLNNSAIEL